MTGNESALSINMHFNSTKQSALFVMILDISRIQPNVDNTIQCAIYFVHGKYVHSLTIHSIKCVLLVFFSQSVNLFIQQLNFKWMHGIWYGYNAFKLVINQYKWNRQHWVKCVQQNFDMKSIE